MKKLFFSLALMSVPFLLSAEMKILAFAGSTREGSYNKQLIQEVAAKAREMGAKVTVIDLKDYRMPIYEADLEKEKGMPQNAKKLRQIMMAHDAMIISSPEYNHSIPAVLKNAIDWCSRSEDGQSSKAAFKGKKVAILCASLGDRAGVAALSHLRLILEDVGAHVVPTQLGIPCVDEPTPQKETTKVAMLKRMMGELLSENPVAVQ